MLGAFALLRSIALGLLVVFGLVTVLVATAAFAFAPLIDRPRRPVHDPSVRRARSTGEVSS